MDISTTSVKKTIVNTLHRYHVIIFVIFVLGGLAVVVFLLNNIIVRSSDSGGYTVSMPTTFDQTTIDRIQTLRTRDDPPAHLDLSQGRVNPFVE